MKGKRFMAGFLSLMLVFSTMTSTSYAMEFSSEGSEMSSEAEIWETEPVEEIGNSAEFSTSEETIPAESEPDSVFSISEETVPAESEPDPVFSAPEETTSAESEPDSVFSAPEETAPAESEPDSDIFTSEETAEEEFTGSLENIEVTVKAPEGAFPEGTVMSVGTADESAVQAAADAVQAEVENVKAVDITFTTSDGKEIEPACAITVSLKASEVAEAEETVIVHVDDEAQAEVIEDTNVEGATVTFEADAFSVYAIVTPDQRATYEFYNGEIKIETQIVKSGDILVEPAVPEGEGEFLGWFVGEGENKVKLTFGTPIESVEAGKTIKAYAEFSKTIYVTFYDADGKTIITIKKVENGSVTTSDVTAQPSVAGEAFDGWTTVQNNSSKKVGENFTTTNDVVLYPLFTSAKWLTFNANGAGATETATQYVKNGEKTVAPSDPQRPGYTFDGWYTAADGGNRFIFGDVLNKDTTVYAHWKASAANYTVIIWKQKVTDAVNAANKTYDYESSTIIESTTGASVTVANTYKSENYTGFHYSTCDSTKKVAADGSTVLNVYYDRNVISVTFNGNNKNYYIITNGNEYEKGNTVTYNGDTYATYVKYQGLYGSELNFTWPTQYLYYYNTNYTWLEDTGWKQNSGSNKGNSLSFIGNFILPTPDDEELTLIPKDAGSRPISFYRQNLDGTWPNDPDLTVNMGSGNFNITDKYTGFTASEYRTKKNSSSWNDWQSAGSPGKYKSFTPSSNGSEIRFTRNSYAIDFMNGTDKVSSQSLKYEAPLSDVKAPGDLSYPGNAADAAHYTFGGWYTDPEGTTPFNFKGKMPANNLVAYAKWVPEQVTVTYNANGGKINDSVEKTSETINYNGKATGAEVAWEDHIFLGWVTEEGNLWNFESPVTDNLELKASWRSDKALKVAYDIENVTDDKEYVEGAQAAVKTYTDSSNRFIGWRLGETVYYPGDLIVVNSENDAKDGNGDGVVTLTAVFDELKNTSITFDANGGAYQSGEEKIEKIVKNLANNEGVDLDKIEAPEWEGHVFLGWSTSKDATEAEFKGDKTEAEEIAADTLNEDKENILYAVWDQYFYIYHSSTGKTENISMNTVRAEGGQFNIVAKTAKDYLYGGYYSRYENSSWEASDAITKKGTSMTPEPNTTYYLKEVSSEYLRPVTYVVYDTHNKNQIVDLYLMTATDDENYASVGFTAEENVAGTLYKTLEVKKEGKNYATLTAKEIFGVDGYLASSESQKKLIVTNKTYTEVPYFVTYDGIKVTGNQKLKVYLRDTTYQGWKTPGITKIVQKATISASAQ